MFKLGFKDRSYVLKVANENATGEYDEDSDADQSAIGDGFDNANR